MNPNQINIDNITGGTSDYDYKFIQEYTKSQYGIDFNNLMSTYQDSLNMQNQQIVATMNQQLADQDLYEQETRQISAEAAKNIGTGTSAIQSQNISEAIETNKENIVANAKKTSEDAAQTLLTQLTSVMEGIFGKLDVSGRFENIVEYENTAQYATDGLFYSIAKSIFNELPNSDEYAPITQDKYQEFLQEHHVISYNELTNDWSITDYGYYVLDSLVNSSSFNNDIDARKPIINSMIDMELGEGAAENLNLNNEEKYNKYFEKYDSFISNYASTWRYTSLGLWSGDISSPEIDMNYSSIDSNFNDAIVNSNVLSGNITEYFDATPVLTDNKGLIYFAEDTINARGGNYKKGANLTLIVNGTVKDSMEVEISDEKANADVLQYLKNKDITAGTLFIHDDKMYIVSDTKEAYVVRPLFGSGGSLNEFYKEIGLPEDPNNLNFR